MDPLVVTLAEYVFLDSDPREFSSQGHFLFSDYWNVVLCVTGGDACTATGAPIEVNITQETVMAGLSCGEVSHLSWEILKIGTDDFLTISDDLVAPTMRLLAEGVGDDTPIVAGESAVAGLAALIAVRSNALLSDELGINEDSQILLFGTEGATDVDIYESIVGRTPADILVGKRAR